MLNSTLAMNRACNSGLQRHNHGEWRQLVQGNFRIDLTEGTVTLTEQGDYVLWGPGIDHWWEALSDSVVITVRWPSSSS